MTQRRIYKVIRELRGAGFTQYVCTTGDLHHCLFYIASMLSLPTERSQVTAAQAVAYGYRITL